MALIGDDCHYFYNQVCNRGVACMYRHVDEARHSKLTCEDWRRGACTTIACPYRHTELDNKMSCQSTPCYYESQPGGCTRAGCEYTHKFPKTSRSAPPLGFVLRPPVSGGVLMQPGWVPPGAPHGPPGAPPTSAPPWHPPPRHPALLHRSAAGPGPGPGGPFQPLLTAPGGPALQEPPYLMDPAGDKTMPLVEPVIINLNSEESDQESVKASPQKHLGRTIVPPGQSQSSNPLDYFLNAKPWVDPRRRRTPSPKRSSPYRERSPSPASPEPQLSPSRGRSASPRGRRRSISVDRQSHRHRRSASLDRSRSQSPDTRDRRRFARRSRTPDRRSSRSPPGGRHRIGPGSKPDLRSRLKPCAPRAAPLPEVKVTGPKIISTKKARKEEEEQKQEETTNNVEKEQPDDYIEDDGPKSLEEIFRERALRSMMDAKRKRILEQKKKRWESVNAEKKFESESLVKSEKGGEDEPKLSSSEKSNVGGEIDGDGGREAGSGAGSGAGSEAGSEADLAEDVDVEIGEGSGPEEQEEEEERPASAQSASSSSSSDNTHTADSSAGNSRTISRTGRAVAEAQQSKPSIKSRLGLRAIEHVSKDVKDRQGLDRTGVRSIKARLGLKASDNSEMSRRPVRSGVIKLSKRASDGSLRGRDGQDTLRPRAAPQKDKELLLVPQITIKNTVDVEERRAGIKQRLGMFIEDESDSDSRRGRKQRDLEGVLLELLEQEDVELDAAELRLLTKKEKKKLLKKLLQQQGRQHEYDTLTKRKKKAKRRGRHELEDRRSRHIRVGARLGPAPGSPGGHSEEEEAGDQLESGEEIELGEPSPEPQDVDSAAPAAAAGAEEEAEVQHREQEEEEEVEEEAGTAQTTQQLIHTSQYKHAQGVAREQPVSLQEEKERRLRLALQPKTLADIRRERARKKAEGEGDNQGAPSPKARRIVLAGEEEEEEETGGGSREPPVTITFKDDTQDLLKRKPHQSALTSSSVWSKTEKTGRRERQIYRPPSLKRIEVSDGPVLVSKKVAEAVKRGGEPPAGRHIVDYGDMFPKKTSVLPAAAARTAAPRPLAAGEREPEARPTIRLQRAPPKVEVKDATVKTFAEIMAEKKRKRQQALQQTQGHTSPLTASTGNSQELSSQTSTTVDKSSSHLTLRLSPVQDTSSNDSTGVGLKLQHTSGKSLSVSSPAKSDFVTVTLPQPSVSTDRATSKPGRWKRRKGNAESAQAPVLRTDESVVCTAEDSESRVSTAGPAAATECLGTREALDGREAGRGRDSPPPVQGTNSTTSAPHKHTSTDNSAAVPEKKQKISESCDDISDLDDDFLNNDDEDLDLDLDNTQDHDKLMQEIDELLN